MSPTDFKLQLRVSIIEVLDAKESLNFMLSSEKFDLLDDLLDTIWPSIENILDEKAVDDIMVAAFSQHLDECSDAKLFPR